MLLGERAALAPVVVEWSDPFPPSTNVAHWQLLTWLAGFVLFLFAAMAWLGWIYSATRFLKIAGVERLHHGPLSAVALHFIPVIGYVMPMLIMSELERATRHPSQWRYLNNNRLAATSWLVGKLSIISLLQSLVLQRNAETPDQYATGLWLVIVATAGCIVGVYLINRFLKHMQFLQTALAASIDGLPAEMTA